MPQEAGQEGLRPDDVLQTVLVGYPVAGVLPLWHDDGAVSYWRFEDPGSVMSQLGKGVIARSPVDETRVREVGMFNPEANLLLVPGRYPDEQGGVAAATVNLTPVPSNEAEAAVAGSDGSDFFSQLGVIAQEAARRGEFVAVENGGWVYRATPFLRMMTYLESRTWQAYIITRPIPRGVPVWSENLQPSGVNDVQVLVAPASSEIFAAHAELARPVIERWHTSLLSLGLSFGPAESGPWPG